MAAQSGPHRSGFLDLVFFLSLGLNAFLLVAYHHDGPDRNFTSHGINDAYFIKRHLGGKIFVIEHEGHSYTVKCQGTLTWLDGIYASGRPMNDDCTYIPSMVGKSIASGLMRKEGDALVFQPWEDSDKEQTADILTIIRDDKY